MPKGQREATLGLKPWEPARRTPGPLGHNDEADPAVLAWLVPLYVQPLSPVEDLKACEIAGEREQGIWLWFFEHYLPRKLLKHYMTGCGADLSLTKREMIDTNPIITLTRSEEFKRYLKPDQDLRITFKGPAGALTNGSLGNFTVNYKGRLKTGRKGEKWTFEGTMSFYDFWDFDKKKFFNRESGRPFLAEFKVRAANMLLTGMSFRIHSVEVPVTQSESDPLVKWAGGTPRSVPDKFSQGLLRVLRGESSIKSTALRGDQRG